MSHLWQYIPAIGATALGIVVGWLVRYFIRRFTTWTPSILGSVITITLGGAAIKFLDNDKTVLWFYPIGLLIGFVIYQIIVMLSLANEAASVVRGIPLIRDFPKDDPRYMR